MNAAAARAAIDEILALAEKAERIYAAMLGPRPDDEEIPGREDFDADTATTEGADLREVAASDMARYDTLVGGLMPVAVNSFSGDGS